METYDFKDASVFRGKAMHIMLMFESVVTSNTQINGVHQQMSSTVSVSQSPLWDGVSMIESSVFSYFLMSSRVF